MTLLLLFNQPKLAPLPAQHPFYNMAGRVASEWSHLEHHLDTIVWALSGGGNEYMACITAQIPGVGGRCKAIVALGELVGISKPLIKKTKGLLGSSYEVADLRNRVVHDPWYIDSGKASQFKTIPYGLKEITEVEINETIGRIKELQKTAAGLKRDILAELKSLREKRA